MTISSMPALAVLAVAVVVGCEARKNPADQTTNETSQPSASLPERQGIETNNDTQGRYAAVNGLKLYYEIHGTGGPLVALHGRFGWATVHAILAKDRQVIAVERQGHGHTADIDCTLTHAPMADDTAALLGQLKPPQADFFGHSLGGNVGLLIAIRHQTLVLDPLPLVTAFLHAPTPETAKAAGR